MSTSGTLWFAYAARTALRVLLQNAVAEGKRKPSGIDVDTVRGQLRETRDQVWGITADFQLERAGIESSYEKT